MINELIAQVEIGEQAKTFLQSELGRYLDGCAKQDLDRVKDELFELDPYKFMDLTSLQNALISIKKRGLIALDIQRYLADAITNGSQALHQLDSTEE